MTMRILLVDDDQEAATQSGRTLIDSGYLPLVAGSGDEALRVAALERPDLILLDTGLPLLDVDVIARAIRANAELQDAQIVAVTATEDDRQRAAEAGFDGFIAGPIDPDRLVDQLAGFVGVSGHMRLRETVRAWGYIKRGESASRLRIRTEFLPAEAHLTLSGELDSATAPMLALWAQASLSNHPRTLALDLGDVTTVDSAGVRLLRQLLTTTMGDGCTLAIAGPTETAIHPALADEIAALIDEPRTPTPEPPA